MSVQDPSFWKRFSKAVHLDENAPYNQPNTGWIESRRPELKHSDSWLERQAHKRRRNRNRMLIGACIFAILVTIVVVIIVWLEKHSWFQNGEKLTFP